MGARRFFLAKKSFSSSLAGEELSDGSLLEEVDGSSISASLCSVVNFELANQKTDYGFTSGDSAHSVYAISVRSGIIMQRKENTTPSVGTSLHLQK